MSKKRKSTSLEELRDWMHGRIKKMREGIKQVLKGM